MPDESLESLAPEEIAARYIARHEWNEGRIAGPRPPGGSLSTWERWLDRDPERGWRVTLEIVRLRPADDEVLEQVWYRLRYLLSQHERAFRDRVRQLVEGNARLRRIVPREALEPGAQRPKPLDIPELVRTYIAMSLNHDDAHELNTLARTDPVAALPLALEVIERGPLHGFRSYDTFSPLHDLLRKHGAEVIDRVEAAAAESVLVRRCLWQMKSQQRHPPRPHDIPGEIWARVERATAGTTDYNTDDPPGSPRSLPPEHERVVAGWFAYEGAFWAWERVHDLVREDPEPAWRVILLLIAQAPDDGVLGAVAAGPLEDLLSDHGAAFIERVEARARDDERFRQALGGVWQSDMPDDLWARVRAAASGAASPDAERGP